MERRIINPWTWQDQWGFVQANCRYAAMLLGVSRLALPGPLVELEATAVK